MRAGTLDRRVTLLSPQAEVDDGYTTIPAGYAPAGTRKARYMPARTSEIFENEGIEAQRPVVWELQYDSLTATIDATWRLQYGARTYDIKGDPIEIGRRRGIRLETVAIDD